MTTKVLSPCQRGHAMTEYILVTVVMALLLFVPQALSGNMPLAEYLARAVRCFFRAYSLLVSVF